jgi:hypothetical protein
MSQDLSVELWLMTQLRGLGARGDFYTILHRGDPHTGLVLVLWRNGHDLALYSRERGLEGHLGWQCIRLAKNDHDRYIARARERDRDLWVIEIETRTGPFPLEGPVYDA